MSANRVFESSTALGEALVAHHELAFAKATAEGRRFSLALTGGSAATSLYPALASARIDWSRVDVFFGDERCVPPTDADSNFLLAKDALLSNPKLAQASVHRVAGELAPSIAASEYEETVRAVTGGVLDVVHLGMGPDGHVCSLFPGHRLLEERTAWVTSLEDSPKPPPARVTFTFPLLSRARQCVFLVMGKAKSDAVSQALGDPSSKLPAALAYRQGNAIFFLDRDAAGELLSAAGEV